MSDAHQQKAGEQPPYGGYFNSVAGAFGHTALMMLRRKRLVLVAVICLLPVLLALALVFLSKTVYAHEGNEQFVEMAETLHINALAPLLALFFATMLIAEDVENQTISYMLTRPLPRSAWLLGRYLAYLAVTGGILTASLLLTYAACTALARFGFNARDFLLALHFCGVALMALVGYGAIMAFLGATTRRPIVIGVLLLYGWQRLATLVPGLIDFLTIQKYTDALLPVLAAQRDNPEIRTALGTFNKEVYAVTAPKAFATLLAIALVFFVFGVVVVRVREYTSARAIGS